MKKEDLPQALYVFVYWLDAWSADKNTYYEGSNYEPIECITPGWLVKETEDYVVLSQMYCEDGLRYQKTFTIPMGMVQRIEELHFS